MENKRIRKHFNLAVRQQSGHTIHVVEAGNPISLALLKQAYEDVYLPAFPFEEEREPLSLWLETLKGNGSSSIVIAIIADEKTLHTAKPVIKGISVGYYYKEEDAGLLAYNAIVPRFRGQGLGSVMVEARKQALLELAQKHGKPLRGIFIECNDPAKISAVEDSIDPAVRIKMFEKWGARIIPINYVQPPLDFGAQKCSTLKLLAYPHPGTGAYPAPEAVEGFLHGIYAASAKYSGCPPEKNPDYRRAVKQLRRLPPAQPLFPPKKSIAPKPPSPG
jgi:GNAT superfamily N-acetyltransferase